MSRRWQQSGRYELKYVIPAGWRSTVLDLIRPFAEPDPKAGDLGHGRKGYQVNSLYFDTARLSDYFERLDQAKVRDRLRVRTYDGPEARRPVFLENKRKCGRMVIKHRSVLCDSRQWLECTGPQPWFGLDWSADGARDYAASIFRQLVEGGRRRPVSTVRYEREAFVDRDPGQERVRLTLDHDVERRPPPPPTISSPPARCG